MHIFKGVSNYCTVYPVYHQVGDGKKRKLTGSSLVLTAVQLNVFREDKIHVEREPVSSFLYQRKSLPWQQTRDFLTKYFHAFKGCIVAQIMILF